MFAQKGTSPIAILEGFRNQDLGLIEYIDQLEAHFNLVEPRVLAFVPEKNRFESLREEAKSLLKQYPDPESYPPLFGLIVGVKDIFHVDGFITRAGSQLPPEVLQGSEADVVTQIKSLGALVLGKTVTTEFAYFAPGPTRNPHNPGHTPGGSSSGSAAAVAAGLVSLAFGTQTIGSITRPASFCGVVGYKPSFDRLSKAGVIPLSHSLDHVGIFAPDLATVKKFIEQMLPDYRTDLGEQNIPLLGIPEGEYISKAEPEMLEHFKKLVSRLENRGFSVKRLPMMEDIEEIIGRHNLITAAEAAQNHEKWFGEYAESYDQKTRELILSGQQIDPEVLEEARDGREKLRGELQTVMDTENVDLWISPAAPGVAPEGLVSTGDPVMNLPWTHSGLPTLSIPAGINTQGLPLGLQLAGRWNQDEEMIGFGSLVQPAIR
jgi:Asp-tRNA(Asn)/Glu-tRNA(Gln) amidotransferase A subunit family amidase